MPKPSRTSPGPGWTLAVLALSLPAGVATAQELEPRAYSPSPVGTNFLFGGYANSSGGVALDGSAPISDVEADIRLTTVGYGRVFGLAGRQASVGVVLPHLWADVSGNVGETAASIHRDGLGDARVRFSLLLKGGPALRPQAFASRTPGPIVGVSIVAAVPTGEYKDDKLINLGSNRWMLKPEIGLSYPIGRWQADLYASVAVYSDNDEFLGRRQERKPLAAFQGHLSYTFRPGLWAAVNATYYTGGATTVDGVRDPNRQDNLRLGATLVVPVAPRQSLQVHYSHGAVTRFGGDFDTIAVAWRSVWMAK